MTELLEARPGPNLTALAVAPAEVFDAIPAGVYVVDAEGRLLRFNARAAQLWGRIPRTGADGDRYCGSFRAFTPEGRPLELRDAPMGEVLRTRRPARDREVEIERPDGGRSVLLVNIEPLLDDDGGLIGAVNCFQDITERALAEREARRSRQDLEDFFENGAVGLHLVSANGVILRANQAELDMLGYSAGEYIGKEIRSFHADPPVIDDILRRLSAGERLDKYPARLIAKDGSIRHVLITSNVHFRDGAFLNTRCFTVDVTGWRQSEAERADSERRARELLNALPVAIYTTDPQGRITFFNEAAVEFSGRTPAIGSDSWCVTFKLYELDGTPLAHEDCPMAATLNTGVEVRGAVAVAERPDGTRTPFMPFPKLLRGADGEVVGAVNMLVDISERVRSEDAQRVLIDELNHRVKNTLATVQSIAAQTLRSTPDDFVENFEARLMALSRAHNLLTRNRWSGVSLAELLQEQLEAHAGEGERLQLEGPSLALSPRIGLLLGMLVHELATNAAKYGAFSTGEGQVRLAWSVVADDRGRNLLRLSWRESGGPPVAPPTRRGFGARLLQRSVETDLGGAVALDFAPSGVTCDIDFPLD